MKSLVTQSVLVRKCNSAYFRYRRNRWRWSPKFKATANVKIDRPIYLLGTQGGGLTLLSRILHRHRASISVTGDHHNWAGDDETQNVLQAILPERLGWRRVDVPGFDSADHNWLYANDAFLPHYRERGFQDEAQLAADYKTVLRRIIALNGAQETGATRFIDKSQSLTVRVGLVRRLLTGCNPKFVLITRDPTALTWRAVTHDRIISGLKCSQEEKFELAVQHWANSFQAALEDREDDLKIWKFEDLLADPPQVIEEICQHVELAYDPAILPGPNDEVPWGSAFDAFNKRKWYPMRPNVSSGYLEDMPSWAKAHLNERAGELIHKLGYQTHV
ncbi:MAG: sulfotransferase [Pseudomonadota bacterium]